MIKKLFVLITTVACCLGAKLNAQVVSTSGNTILVDGERYTIRGTCYSPRTIGASWYDYPDLGFPSYTAFADDITMMNNICLNTLRTYYPIFDKTRLDQLAEANIKVIITFPYEDLRSNVANEDRYEMKNGSYQNYINTFKDHPAILMWSFGNEMNYFMDDNLWYAALETVAQWTHINDPNHPVTTANGEVPTSAMINTLSPSVDVWGANIYRNAVANTPLGEYSNNGGTKPFWYSEIGVDSYNHNTNSVDEASQSTGFSNMWGDIEFSIENNGICSGATFFNWTDEWWKSGSFNVQNINGSAPAGSFYPDGITDEEYYGILNQDRSPKAVYYTLQSLWAGTCTQEALSSFLIEDFECSRHLDYFNFDGAFEIVDNPQPSAVNQSQKCIKYDRANVQYAAIVAQSPQIEDVSDYINRLISPTIDFYSDHPGTVITLNLESSNDIGEFFPSGRVAIFTATSTKTNEWETLTFELSNARDINISPTTIDQFALLINSGDITDNNTYYYDNLKGPEVIGLTELSLINVSTSAINGNCIDTEHNGYVTIQNNSNESINFGEYNPQINLHVHGATSQTYTTTVDNGTLAASSSLEVLVSDMVDLTESTSYNVIGEVHLIGDVNCLNNSTSIDLQFNDCVTSNKELVNQQFSIYPNPSSDYLNIQLNKTEKASLQLLMIEGDIISEHELNSNTESINLKTLENGFYIIKIINENGSFAQKFEILK